MRALVRTILLGAIGLAAAWALASNLRVAGREVGALLGGLTGLGSRCARRSRPKKGA
jgi:hypothetical protein